MSLGLSRKMTVYLIQHTHTDIGYTDNQDTITAEHIDFIREAVRIANDPRHADFRWTCETLWGVERFLEEAGEEEKNDFFRHCREGRICVSASYLNMTELICEEVLRDRMQKVISVLNENGVTVKSAMTADVNGYSWGFADILASFGVTSLISEINACHGHTPIARPHTPFIWEGVGGCKITVWLNEHYQWANLLGFWGQLDTPLEDVVNSCEEKVFEYFEKMLDNGYKFDFCPLSVSGTFSDNAPPDEHIDDLVKLWNEKHSDTLEFKQVTLDEFFEKANSVKSEFSVYRGDWNDWWSDGVSSTPNATKLFRAAQRLYLAARELDPERKFTDTVIEDRLTYALALFGEHTWGHYDSIWNPCTFVAAEIHGRKEAFASEALSLARQNMFRILRSMGYSNKKRRYLQAVKMINPSRFDITSPTVFSLGYMYAIPKIRRMIDENGTVYNCSLHRAGTVAIPMQIGAGESKVLSIYDDAEPNKDKQILWEEDGAFVSDRYVIKIDREKGGISSVFDKKLEIELIDQNTLRPAFSLLYETSPDRPGLDYPRRSERTKQYTSELQNVAITANNDFRAELTLSYTLQGTSMASVTLTLYRDICKIDVSLQIIKDNEMNSEGIYMVMPINKTEKTLWLDKAGALIRPGIDQLPESCMNFFITQNGFAYVGRENYISVTCLDAPLVWLGELDDRRALECCGDKEDNGLPISSWVMNNFWQTNFKASIAGPHEFRYSIGYGDMGDKICCEKDVFDKMKAESVYPIVFPIE